MTYLTAMKLSLGAAVTAALILATASFSSASYTDQTTPGAVSVEEYQQVHQWTVKSWVETEFDRSGTLMRAWTGGDGRDYRMKSYPTDDGGTVLATFYHYVTKHHGSYGWVLWSQKWCTADGACSDVAPDEGTA